MNQKTCNKCNTAKFLTEFWKDKGKMLGVHGTCKDCFRIVDRKRYYANHEEMKARKNKTGKKMMKLYPEKWRARQLLRYAVKIGQIKKMSCACGKKETEGHHPDYSKPLEIVWLCVKHHHELHRKSPSTLT